MMTLEATMHRIRFGSITLGLVLLAGMQSVVVLASEQAQPNGIRFGKGQPRQSTSRANPYGGLFKAPDITTSAASGAALPVEARGPRMVCGMTIIPADPKTDPKIAIEPKRRDTRYTIRAIEPPICK